MPLSHIGSLRENADKIAVIWICTDHDGRRPPI